MKPLIGLTPTPERKTFEHGTFRLHTLSESYSRAVIASGGIPVMLPSNNLDIEGLLDRLDAVIVTGGGDIDPAEFGQPQHEKTDDIDAERDAFELGLVHEAIRRDMPLLGICRGLQILNVALGGTLYQDVNDLIEGSQDHRQQERKIHHEELFQQAVLEAGDHPLRELMEGANIGINSFHHQSIDRLAEQLRVMARTEDGVVEAVYNPSAAFCLAVQWHPEMLAAKHANHAAIFRSFVEAAITYRTRTTNREVPELV